MSFYRVATLLISVALLAAVQLIAAPAAAVEHSPQPGSAQVTQKPSHTTTVHTLIQARLDDDGRIEFRLMLARREPLPPAQRYLPEPLTHGGWVSSSDLHLVPGLTVQILARRNRDRIEIALRRDGEIIFPENRYLPRRDALANHGWVQSGPILLELRLPHPLTRALAVTAGREHSCTITAAQTILCWGSNRMGQLDAPSGRFTSISAGRYHTCALAVRGEVSCWGDSDFRQTQAPKGPFTAIEAAGDHTCGLTEQERLKCWGQARNNPWKIRSRVGFDPPRLGLPQYLCAQTGNGQAGCWPVPGSGRLVDDRSYISVATGSAYICALSDVGELYCWGDNDYQQASPPSGRFSALSAGRHHTCALLASSAIACWGVGDWGQIDPPNGRFRALSAGDLHNCALSEAAAVYCWGDNTWGQSSPPYELRPDYYRSRTAAVRPVDLQVRISAGGHANETHACALTEAGELFCWAWSYGSSFGAIDAPPLRFVAVSADGDHTCALTAEGRARCWGRNRSGEATPPPERFSAIDNGAKQSCGLTSSGQAVCWGRNYFDGNRFNAPPGRFTAITAGGLHACALTVSGESRCWGFGQFGTLNAPSGRYISLSSQWEHTCALTREGAIECWGADWGGQTTSPHGRFTAVSSGKFHNCALTQAGEAHCWGIEDKPDVINAPSGPFVAIDAGRYITCAFTPQLKVVCWGPDWFDAIDIPRELQPPRASR